MTSEKLSITLRQRGMYVVQRVVLWLAATLPERLAYGAAALLGRVYWWCSPKRRAIAMYGLRNALKELSDAERARIGRIATGNVFKVPVDMVRAIRMASKGRHLERYDVSQMARIAPDGPYIALSAHLGSWEVAAFMMASLGGEVHAVARTFKNPRLQEYLQQARQKMGLHLYPRRGGLRPVVRALQRGHITVMAVDQSQRIGGIVVPFFGEPATTEKAAATLAVRSGYPLVVGAGIRIGSGFRFYMDMEGTILPRRTGNIAADVEHTVRQVNAMLEALILRHPEQYLWIHDRYRISERRKRTARR